MTITVEKRGISIPASIQRRAGFRYGDRLSFRVLENLITIIPEVPKVDDEYTPRQRKIIDARLAKAMKGPYYGPFETHKDLIKFLHSQKLKKVKKIKS